MFWFKVACISDAIFEQDYYMQGYQIILNK